MAKSSEVEIEAPVDKELFKVSKSKRAAMPTYARRCTKVLSLSEIGSGKRKKLGKGKGLGLRGEMGKKRVAEG